MAALNRWFNRFANATARLAGKPLATAMAVVLVLAWAASGPVFHYSENWQLVINTGTTIITFLMVFVIQHSQNCDSASLHIKLDEIISVLRQADDAMMDLSSLDPDELDKLQETYRVKAALARENAARKSHKPKSPPA
jgi:low affinity Fe/Cu permease